MRRLKHNARQKAPCKLKQIKIKQYAERQMRICDKKASFTNNTNNNVGFNAFPTQKSFINGTDRTSITKIAVNIKEENYICLRQKVSVYQR